MAACIFENLKSFRHEHAPTAAAITPRATPWRSGASRTCALHAPALRHVVRSSHCATVLLGLGPHIGAASPYFPCLGAMVQARCWKMHHGTTEQLLAVYPGTPTLDVLPAVRELFGFSETAPLRFRTEDGIPVALSSHLPDGVSLRVAVESGSPQQPAGTAATSTPASAGGPPPSDYAGGVSPRCGVNDRLMPKLCRDCQQLQSCRQRDMQTGDVGELSLGASLPARAASNHCCGRALLCDAHCLYASFFLLQVLRRPPSSLRAASTRHSRRQGTWNPYPAPARRVMLCQ